jgi:hypothetical protein
VKTIDVRQSIGVAILVALKTLLLKLQRIVQEVLGSYVQSKIHTEQKLHLQPVHFCSAYSPDSGIVGIVITPIIH